MAWLVGKSGRDHRTTASDIVVGRAVSAAIGSALSPDPARDLHGSVDTVHRASAVSTQAAERLPVRELADRSSDQLSVRLPPPRGRPFWTGLGLHGSTNEAGNRRFLPQHGIGGAGDEESRGHALADGNGPMARRVGPKAAAYVSVPPVVPLRAL